MSYQLTCHEKRTFLHVVATGPDNRKETILRYMEEALGECVRRKHRRVLVEERLEGPRLKMLDVFEIALEISLKVRGSLDAVAFVDAFAEGDDKWLKLAANVTASRGLKARIFPDVAEAEAWLLSLDRGGR